MAEFTGELISSVRIQSELMIVCFLSSPITLEGLPAPVFNLGMGKGTKIIGLVQMMIKNFNLRILADFC